MFERIAELYFNFWDKLGASTDMALIIFLIFAIYLVVKRAVRKGIISAFNEITNEHADFSVEHSIKNGMTSALREMEDKKRKLD